MFCFELWSIKKHLWLRMTLSETRWIYQGVVANNGPEKRKKRSGFFMKKIAIVTLMGYENYGNRFQNFAAQQVLKRLDYEVTTLMIDFQNIGKFKRFLDIFIKNATKDAIGIVYKKLTSEIKNRLFCFLKQEEIKKEKIEKDTNIQRLVALRKSSFYKFVEDTTHVTVVKKTSSMRKDQFKYYVIGSDQVWNPYGQLPTPYDFLSFASKEKRISYSASFGVSNIPKQFASHYRRGLNGIPNISVREEAGAKIVKELTGRDVPVLVDPTMMLDAEDWRKIAQPIRQEPEGEYLLTFFLGQVSNERRSKIQNIADKEGYITINLNDISDPERYVIAPDEFVSYIDKASFIVTDSFHGTVFSILFNKPFVVFDRLESSQTKASSMHSRIETLLSKFRLEDRYEGNMDKCKNLYETEYSHVPAILEEEREKAYKFLREAMDN